MSLIVFVTSYVTAKACVSTNALDTTSLSVFAAACAFISASVGASATTGDAPFRSVSVWPTFPAFNSQPMRDVEAEPVHREVCHPVF